jgi:hypothetical protein
MPASSRKLVRGVTDVPSEPPVKTHEARSQARPLPGFLNTRRLQGTDPAIGWSQDLLLLPMSGHRFPVQNAARRATSQ